MQYAAKEAQEDCSFKIGRHFDRSNAQGEISPTRGSLNFLLFREGEVSPGTSFVDANATIPENNVVSGAPGNGVAAAQDVKVK